MTGDGVESGGTSRGGSTAGAACTGMRTCTGGRVSPFLRSNMYRRAWTDVGVVGSGAGSVEICAELNGALRSAGTGGVDCCLAGEHVSGWVGRHE